MNLHICNDEKFIDGFIKNSLEFTQTKNVFIVINIHREIKHVKNKNIIHVDNNYKDLSETVKTLDPEINRIYFHSITKLIAEVIDEYRGKVPLIWLFFGAEIFSLYTFRNKFLLSKTRKLLNIISDDRFLFKANPIELRRQIINSRHYFSLQKNHDQIIKKAIKKIDFVGHYIKDDIELYVKKINPKIKWVNWNYYSIDQMQGHYETTQKSNQIILGNSGSEYNNHLDALSYLKKIGANCDVITPLSYGGGSKYVQKVMLAGEKYLGDRFQGLTDFIKPERYYGIISECKAGVFFNLRSQAAANIFHLIKLNIPIFLLKESTLFSFFQDNHIHVFPMESLKDFLNQGLNEKDFRILKENEKILRQLFGNAPMQEKYKNLLGEEIYYI